MTTWWIFVKKKFGYFYDRVGGVLVHAIRWFSVMTGRVAIGSFPCWSIIRINSVHCFGRLVCKLWCSFCGRICVIKLSVGFREPSPRTDGFRFSTQSITRFWCIFGFARTRKSLIVIWRWPMIRSRFCFFQIRIIGKERTCSPRYTHN